MKLSSTDTKNFRRSILRYLWASTSDINVLAYCIAFAKKLVDSKAFSFFFKSHWNLLISDQVEKENIESKLVQWTVDTVEHRPLSPYSPFLTVLWLLHFWGSVWAMLKVRRQAISGDSHIPTYRYIIFSHLLVGIHFLPWVRRKLFLRLQDITDSRDYTGQEWTHFRGLLLWVGIPLFWPETLCWTAHV